MDAFLGSLGESHAVRHRGPVLRTYLWRGISRINTGEVDGALSDFRDCYSLANDTSAAERPVAANALFWLAQVVSDVAELPQTEPDMGKDLAAHALDCLDRLDRRFALWADEPTRAVLARASYLRGHHLAMRREFDDAVTSFKAALRYSDDLDDGYFGSGFRKVAEMRSAALVEALKLPPPAVEPGWVHANLQYLTEAERRAKEVARLNAEAEAFGGKTEPFPMARARLRLLGESLLVPMAAKRIARTARAEANNERKRLEFLKEQARSRHEAACQHVRSCQVYGYPLIIMLRNFDFGNRVNSGTPGDGVAPPWFFSGGRALDLSILNYYSHLGPVVMVGDGNTIDADIGLPADAMVLYLSDEAWSTTVRGLVKLSSLILIVAAFETASLRAELQMVSELKRSNVTLLTVQETDPDGIEVANIISGRNDRTSIPLIPSEFEGRLAAAVRASDPPSRVRESQLAETAISYVITARQMSLEDRFLHLSEVWGSPDESQ